MKTVPLLVSYLLLPLLCAAGSDTAYQALRVVGKTRGQDTMNQVISVQGLGGAPQPGAWKILLDDPAARGGVRELDVARGKIVAEHTPVGAPAGGALDFHRLNLDSEGAFTIAQKEAQKARVSFDTVDYALRGAEGGNAAGAPVWVVTLRDATGETVGGLRVAADTGTVVGSDLFGKRNTQGPAREEAGEQRQRSVAVEEEQGNDSIVDRGDARSRQDDGGDGDGDAPRGRLRVGHRISKALHQAGAELEEFFTGRRTMDRRYRDGD